MLASRRSKEYSTSSLRAVSSAGQSRGLLIPRSRVRIPDGAPVRLPNARDASRISGVFRFCTPQAPMGLRLAAHPPPRRPSQGATHPRIPVLVRPCTPESPKVCVRTRTAFMPKKGHLIYLRRCCQQGGEGDPFRVGESYNADFWHFSLSGRRRHAARNSRACPLVRSSPP